MSFLYFNTLNNLSKINKKCPEKDDIVDFKYIGGKINSNTLHSLIKNGYSKKPNKINDIDGYVLDKSLSGTRTQVYHHPDTNHLIVNHRGTSGIHDLFTDIQLMMGNKNNARFQHGKKITDQALTKYDTDNVSIVGHSLGSAIGKEANRDHNHETINVNPAITMADLFDKQNDNETIIRSSIDPISALHTLNPFSNKTRTIDTKAKSYNPVKEHNSDILLRLDNIDVGV